MQNRINKLVKKYKNKKIVLYGIGFFCRKLFENNDFSKLNIIAVSDISFETANPRIFHGIKCVTPQELRDMQYDAIILMVERPKHILNFMRKELLVQSKNFATCIEPFLIDSDFKSKIETKKLYQNIFLSNDVDYYVDYFLFGKKIFTKIRKSSSLPYKINGNNNKIFIIKRNRQYEIPANCQIEGLSVNIKGDNNNIFIKSPCKLINSSILIKSHNNAKISIGESPEIKNLDIIITKGEDQIITLGEGFTSEGAEIVGGGKGCNIDIEEDCMFSNHVLMRVDDGHTLIDAKTNEILNIPNHLVKIGKHSWIGHGVKINKNVCLAEGTIVGMGSVVTKKFEEPNVIIAGNPAKIIKRDICWDRKSAYGLDLERKKHLEEEKSKSFT